MSCQVKVKPGLSFPTFLPGLRSVFATDVVIHRRLRTNWGGCFCVHGWAVLGTASVPALPEGFLSPQSSGDGVAKLEEQTLPAAFCPALSPEPSSVVILMWDGMQSGQGGP